MSGDAKQTGRGPEHTPLPWEYRSEDGRHYIAYGLYMIVEDVWGTIEARDEESRKANAREREANAKLIVEAVNSHATLTEENRRLRAELDFQLDAVQRILYHYPDRLPGSVKATLEQMRLKAKAALAGK
jgi:hypothetical protein